MPDPLLASQAVDELLCKISAGTTHLCWNHSTERFLRGQVHSNHCLLKIGKTTERTWIKLV